FLRSYIDAELTWSAPSPFPWGLGWAPVSRPFLPISTGAFPRSRLRLGPRRGLRLGPLSRRRLPRSDTLRPRAHPARARLLRSSPPGGGARGRWDCGGRIHERCSSTTGLLTRRVVV